ncbi:MAG TPA: response regulator transcription factor [Bacillota bacterium]|nr:response regulator transcription factor [Bacillota bacterium]
MGALLLLVEDNEQILRANERTLSRKGYDIMAASSLAEARKLMAKRRPDAIVLDIMLPDGSGLDFIGEIGPDSKVPVLLLTGLATSEDVIRGLEAGGDDYLTKPYDFGVLTARIEALLRRAGRVPEKLSKGMLDFDIRASRAFLCGEDMLLTQKEFAVLLVLAENEGRPLSSEYIYRSVWKQTDAGGESAVKTVVSRIRKKLGERFSIDNDKRQGSYIFSELPL